jgi:Uma2 family endonuclease
MAIAAPALLEEQRPLTLDDLLALDEGSGERYEIIGGELIVSPTPVSGHQHVSYRLTVTIGPYIEAKRLGQLFYAPMTVRLGRHDVVQPDLLFLSAANRALIQNGIVEGAPDLIIEILSPSTQRVDLVRKRALYERAGVREYWIVDLDRRAVRQLVLREGHYEEGDTSGGVLRSSVIDGLQIEIASLFHDLWS